MTGRAVEPIEKLRKDRAKTAVALAIRCRWDEAVEVNRAILADFPRDMESYNRLGKALSELGRNREAQESFRRALEVSPQNSIARKNLDRLLLLGDETPRVVARSGATPHKFIEESGKTGLTPLLNLAPTEVLLKLAPGHLTQLESSDTSLRVTQPSGEYVGQVEPRLASRLIRLIKGGNRYEATVTSVGDQELTVMIREVFRHPSQAGTVSFPSRSGISRRVYAPNTLLGYDLNEEEGEEGERVTVKDWSDDDTEPGDDDAFTPVVHRIIDPRAEGVGDAEEDI